MGKEPPKRVVVPGRLLEGKELEEHLKSFSDMEECFNFLDKQQSSLLTKSKKCVTVKTTTKRKEKPKCENSTNIRKKPLKKSKT